jgi:thiol-disulfide isomerase/thioredoxin
MIDLVKPAQLAFIAAASIFVYGFVSTAKDGERRRACSAICELQPNYAAYSRKAPDFELSNLKGKKVRLSDYRGRVVILNFWSKSCPPCLEEMPSLAELGQELLHRTDVVLLTVTTDESAADATKTLQSILGESMPNGTPPFEVLVDPEAQVVGSKFGTKLYPETWIIDADGVVAARVDGARDWADPVVLNFAESLDDPLSCGVSFTNGRPRGEFAGICQELGH